MELWYLGTKGATLRAARQALQTLSQRMASIGEVQKLSKFFRTPAQARTGLNLQMNGIWGVLSVETHDSLFEAQDRRFPPVEIHYKEMMGNP